MRAMMLLLLLMLLMLLLSLLLLLLERPSVVVTPHLSLTPGLAGDNKCRDAERRSK